jgi:F0F1-type ATP synthase assembly protein I
MALSQVERRAVESRVLSIIFDDFGKDFQDVYSYAVTVLELAPEQANNEVRNALNHIVRALAAQTMQEANQNLGQSEGHIERARRDCIKLAVIHVHEQIKSDMLSIEQIEGALPISLRTRLKTIEEQGYQARKAEAEGDGNTIDKYADVLAALKRFRDDLNTQYTTSSNRRRWLARQLYRIRTHATSLVVGIVIGVMSHWLYDHAGGIDAWGQSAISRVFLGHSTR